MANENWIDLWADADEKAKSHRALINSRIKPQLEAAIESVNLNKNSTAIAYMNQIMRDIEKELNN